MQRSIMRALNWGMIALSFGVAAWLSPRIPELVPTHWDARGHVNGYMPKPYGVFVLPFTMLVLHGLLQLVPRLARNVPRSSFGRAYDVVHSVTLAFLLFVTMVSLRAAAGEKVPIVQAIGVALGLLLIVIGNLLGKVRRNFFLGIRTPWTLASDEVWLRTHRLGGKTFVVGGAIVIVGVAMGANIGLCSVVALLAALIPAAYSYLVYRRLPH
jgi:uncharacterized membrane protein